MSDEMDFSTYTGQVREITEYIREAADYSEQLNEAIQKLAQNLKNSQTQEKLDGYKQDLAELNTKSGIILDNISRSDMGLSKNITILATSLEHIAASRDEIQNFITKANDLANQMGEMESVGKAIDSLGDISSQARDLKSTTASVTVIKERADALLKDIEQMAYTVPHVKEIANSLKVSTDTFMESICTYREAAEKTKEYLDRHSSDFINKRQFLEDTQAQITDNIARLDKIEQHLSKLGEYDQLICNYVEAEKLTFGKLSELTNHVGDYHQRLVGKTTEEINQIKDVQDALVKTHDNYITKLSLVKEILDSYNQQLIQLQNLLTETNKKLEAQQNLKEVLKKNLDAMSSEQQLVARNISQNEDIIKEMNAWKKSIEQYQSSISVTGKMLQEISASLRESSEVSQQIAWQFREDAQSRKLVNVDEEELGNKITGVLERKLCELTASRDMIDKIRRVLATEKKKIPRKIDINSPKDFEVVLEKFEEIDGLIDSIAAILDITRIDIVT